MVHNATVFPLHCYQRDNDMQLLPEENVLFEYEEVSYFFLRVFIYSDIFTASLVFRVRAPWIGRWRSTDFVGQELSLVENSQAV